MNKVLPHFGKRRGGAITYININKNNFFSLDSPHHTQQIAHCKVFIGVDRRPTQGVGVRKRPVKGIGVGNRPLQHIEVGKRSVQSLGVSKRKV